MTWLSTTTIATLLLCWPGIGLAHDASQHKGTPLEGTIEIVTSTTVTIKTPTGASVSVTVSEETAIATEAGPATLAALRTGEHVTVHGPKLPGGGVAAKEIMVGTRPGPGGSGHPDH